MRMIFQRRLAWTLLLTVAFICILSHLFQTNWTLNARLNLLLDGYAFSHLEPVDKIKEFPTPAPIEFSTFLVYDGKKYVGYLNNSGDFKPISGNNPEKIGSISQQKIIKLEVLFYSQWICLFFSFTIGLWMFWPVWKDGLNSKAQHIH